ncbi:uncharacterized protein LOC110096947 [Dendrobium catenatum]|uniref:uncharacterized protein LOC110096947 n=1 Tax=Dendrobium catenatum TaxID=906689 RepID=UPI00109EE81E|nr:uncharacterized protein LOC110096947 [Dendrobium catenatum]
MDSIGFQKRLDDLVSLVGSLTKTTKEAHVDSPHSRYVPHSLSHASRKMPHYAYQPRSETNPQRPHLESHYHLPTFDGSSDPYYLRDWVRQLEDYFESCHIPESHQIRIAKSHLKGRALQFWIKVEDHRESRGEYLTWKDMRRDLNLKYRPSTSDHHLEPHPTSSIGTNRGHYWGRDHPSFSNDRVAAPPCRSSFNLGDRPFSGSSVDSSPYDSPLGSTSNQLSQPLASPVLDPASVLLIEKCINKKTSSEPKTECIHFVDANDIKDNEDFFEEETKVNESDSQHDLNPELEKLEPLNVDTLAHPDPSLLEDNSLNKVCLNDSNVILKEANLTLNTLNLNLEDLDLAVTPTKLTLDNLDDNDLESEVVKLNLLPDVSPNLTNPEPVNLKVIPKSDSIDDKNMSSEDNDLILKVSEPNLNNGSHLILLESILGITHLDLHFKECDFRDWAYLTTPRTDFNVRENLNPHFHITNLAVVPSYVMDTIPNFLSPIPAGDSFGYSIMVVSQETSSYLVPDSFVLPTMFLSLPVKDNLSPSGMNLQDDTIDPRRQPTTITETSYRSVVVAKDVFIAPPKPVPLGLNTLDPRI